MKNKGRRKKGSTNAGNNKPGKNILVRDLKKTSQMKEFTLFLVVHTHTHTHFWSNSPHLIPPSLDESGFMEVECFTILHMVTTSRMTLTCQNRHGSELTGCT